MSADFALTYNFQGTHILGTSRGHLCDPVIFLFVIIIIVIIIIAYAHACVVLLSCLGRLQEVKVSKGTRRKVRRRMRVAPAGLLLKLPPAASKPRRK